MVIDRDTLLFFDASCLLAAAGSSTGGSAFLLSVCIRGFLKAAVVSEAPFLITLDQGLEKRVNEGNLEVKALSPGGFIKTILIQHHHYSAMR
jgi:hypothetical protein